MNIPIAYSIKDAARSLGIGRTKLYDLIAQGEVAVIKIGTRTLVPREELAAFMDRLRAAA